MKRNKNFGCPYHEIECIELNTKTMKMDGTCKDCIYFNNGIRPTGAIINLKWLSELFKKLTFKK